MRFRSSIPTVVAALFLSTTFVHPSDAGQRQRNPNGESRGGGQSRGGGGGGESRGGGGGQSGAVERRAGPRGGGSGSTSVRPQPGARGQTERQQAPARQQPGVRQQPESRPQPESRQQSGARQGSGVDRQRGDNRADGRRWDGDRNGGNGPRVAVPRQGPPPRRNGSYYYNGSRYYPRTRVYNYYNYYPRYWYNPWSFGYGPAGRGYVYFDVFYNSYVWHPRTIVRYDTYGTYGYPTGELRIQVKPRDAQVFVDGSYAGTVDDFDGVFQSLRLEDGEYHIEIVLQGYEPLAFDVRIMPGEKTTYKGDLLPELP